MTWPGWLLLAGCIALLYFRRNDPTPPGALALQYAFLAGLAGFLAYKTLN